MKQLLTLTLALMVGTSANALTFKINEQEKTISGIQTMNIEVSHNKNTDVSLSIRGVGPLDATMFKSPLEADLQKISLIGGIGKPFPLYFKVPQSGYFTFDICATTSPEPLAVGGSQILANVRVCDTVIVDNR